MAGMLEFWICSLFTTVALLNLSSNGEGYAWNFGDGSTSDLEDPVHVYEDMDQQTAHMKMR